MNYKRVLTIQDISCVGQCSLTVALPIISACGIETAVLPSAVLSTHTAFSGYTFRDLTDDIPKIAAHWEKENIKFDAIYTGYLGSTRQIDLVAYIIATAGKEGCIKVVDPAMADSGKLYSGFDLEYVSAMRVLCAKADYVLPNITEACFLTGIEYKTEYDRDYIDLLLGKLSEMGCKNIILTGVSYSPFKTGIVVYENSEYSYYEHELLPIVCHGTGDIFASAFVGALLRGKSTYHAAKIAGDFAVECIKATADDKSHWYGAKFEPVLGMLISALD
ncbi:MAG: pyridoxamine kinase [Monoglobales bacterium]